MSLQATEQEVPSEPSLQSLALPPSNHPQDWHGGIDDYLAENAIVCTNAMPLDSGTSCYLWRLEGFEDAEALANGHQRGEPVVMKCADSTPKYDELPVAADRLQVEVKALQSTAVIEACRQETSVQVPRVLRTTRNGFIMTWAGDMDLRVAYKTDESMDAAAIGARLGRWLASLHLVGIDTGSNGWDLLNDELGKFYGPGGIQEETVRSAVGDEKEVERIMEVLCKPDRVRTLTPWDFRPMNTLVQKDGGNGSAPRLTIVDWELCHYGEPSNDIRMWVAEAMVMEAKFGDRGMLSSFLAAYKNGVDAAIIDEAFVCKVAAAAGVFILFLMPIGAQVWDCTNEDVEPWRDVALQYIRAGAVGDMAWLRQSCLKPLLD